MQKERKNDKGRNREKEREREGGGGERGREELDAKSAAWLSLT